MHEAALRPLSPRTLAIERALRAIERELNRHLTTIERIAITDALEQLAGDVEARAYTPW